MSSELTDDQPFATCDTPFESGPSRPETTGDDAESIKVINT